MAIDATNKCLVGVQGDKIRMMLPPMGFMSSDEALVLAAWLVTLADPLDERFTEVLKAVRS